MTQKLIFEAAIEVSQVLRAPHLPAAVAAEAALRQINRFLGCPSLQLAAWDDASEQYTTLCVESSNDGGHHKPALVAAKAPPADGREGLHLPLFHHDQHVGMLTGTSPRSAPPGDSEMAALAALAPALGSFMARASQPAPSTPDGSAVLSDDLRIVSSSSEDHDLLATITEFLHRDRLAAGLLTRFLVWPPSGGAPIRVRVDPNGHDGHWVTWCAAPLPGSLSRRQVEVVTGIVDGLSNAAIAKRLFSSPRTVSKHVEHILVRLGVTNRCAVTRVAVTEGIYLLDEHPEPLDAAG